MYEVQNQTPFVAALLPAMDPDGGEGLVAVVKATYTIVSGGNLVAAEQQVAPILGDSYYADAETSSLRYASDAAPGKRGTDVALIGSAYAQGGRSTQVDVSLQVGPLRKSVRVVGDRVWQKGRLGAAPSEPTSFTSMPLVYERAFGGIDRTDARSGPAFESRNPVGRGFVANPRRDDLDGLPLPNLEDPEQPVRGLGDRPAPAAFGFLAPMWEPRKSRAGTMDAAWLETRHPLPPSDFDPRFYNAAHPDLISATFLRGGESVRATNVLPGGEPLSFRIPGLDVVATFFIDNVAIPVPSDLDTVVIEPDERRVTITWRARIRCHRKLKYVQGVRLTASERGN